MTEHIDTREGWQELDVVTPDSIYQLAEYDPLDGSVVRAWVRVSPMSPLPTEDGTSISVKWKQPRGYHMLTLSDNRWYPVGKGSEGMGWHFANALADRITEWTLVAEPCENHYGREDLNRAEENARREAAKKILERYQESCFKGASRDSAIKTAIGDFL